MTPVISFQLKDDAVALPDKVANIGKSQGSVFGFVPEYFGLAGFQVGDHIVLCFTILEAHLLEADRQNLHKPIHPGAVIQALKKHAPENAIICSDVGDHTYWLYKRFVCEGQTTLLCANMAGMGFGIPAAVACSFAEPGRRVIAVTGDGGFGMAGMEFTTAVHNRLLLTIVVFNDGKLKNIKKEMEEYGYPEYRVDFPNPDFARFASTAGGTGFYVEEPEDLDEAFRKALASSGPSLIDVRVDPDKYIEAIHRV